MDHQKCGRTRFRRNTQVTDSETEGYVIDAEGEEYVAAALALIEKLIAAKAVSPARLVSLAKVYHVLSRLPEASAEIDVNFTISTPNFEVTDGVRVRFNWTLHVEGQHVTLSYGGYFYQPLTGGDSFTSVVWEAAPEEESAVSDFRSQQAIVPRLSGFIEGVEGHSDDFESFTFDVYDDGNELLYDE